MVEIQQSFWSGRGKLILRLCLEGCGVHRSPSVCLSVRPSVRPSQVDYVQGRPKKPGPLCIVAYNFRNTE